MGINPDPRYSLRSHGAGAPLTNFIAEPLAHIRGNIIDEIQMIISLQILFTNINREKMKLILVLGLSTLLLLNVSAQETVRLFGKVTDFNSIPIDSVSVLLKNDKFEDLYKTMADKDGNYSIVVPKGKYYCLYAIKSKDYLKTKLEYWAWNVPLYNDLNLNPQYERMEIYGVNAFEPQVGPFDTYMIYFRPMSLTKFLTFTNGRNIRELEQKAYINHDTIDIAPKKISQDELSIKINDKDAKVLTVKKR